MQRMNVRSTTTRGKPSQGDIHVHHRQMRALTAEDNYRMAPIMSEQQLLDFDATMSGINRPAGGYIGCGYAGYDQGVVCQNAVVPTFAPRAESFFSNWVSNVDYPYGPNFPQPNIMADGTLEQIFANGGSGQNPCLDDCSCENDPDCTCRQSVPDVVCGYPAVNQNCLEPVPNGAYPSLTACERATSLGFYGR